MRDGKYREDLKTAIKHISRALKLFPAGRPQVERLTLMCVLGSDLRKWFDTSGKQNLAQIKQSISILQAAASIIEGPHVFWAEAVTELTDPRGYMAAMIQHGLGHLKETLSLLEECIEIFPLLTARGLSDSDREYTIRSAVRGIAASATALSLVLGDKPYKAPKFLEIGRNLFNVAMELDVNDVSLDPNLLSKFRNLRLSLENSRQQHMPISSNQLSIWLKFPRPPTLAEILNAVRDDAVVVVNNNSARYDAFLIEKKHGIRAIRLDKIKNEDFGRWLRSLSDRPRLDLGMLEWLWDVIAEPVLDGLAFSYPPPPSKTPHVWWIMIGSFSHFPIHAAGVHTLRSKTVIDRVISSYTPSLRAFVNGRAKPLDSQLQHQDKNALLVAMTKSMTRPDTLGVHPISLFPATPSPPPGSPTPTRATVLAELQTSCIFHFAGHGLSHAYDPSQSGLLLDDGLLTVADLHDNKLHSPFLGYLSACRTGATENPAFIDDGINLNSTCALAGFRHVIGTLWQVSGRRCPDVAGQVYGRLLRDGMTDEAVAGGLHDALVMLRDEWAETVERQCEGMREFIEEVDEEVILGEEGEVMERLIETVRVRRKIKVIKRIVEASWIPYVHYGP
ncbi:CHAT domain-containing protein [Ustulina deusta]|nr:CHAT domain-containing protein [Ustulina deusta]